jgi:hypothetical protein
MAITSKEINLVQLDNELGGKGLVADLSDATKKLIKPADDSDVTEAQLEAGIAAHIAVTDPEPTVADKLASVGLSVTDLKAALGL